MALKLENLSVEELDCVIAEAQQRKQQAREALRQQARARVDAVLAETGYTLEELYGSDVRRKSAKRAQTYKSKKPPMFRNPDNLDETWSGYGGRKPQWFVEAINRGLSREDLMIRGQSNALGTGEKARTSAKPARPAPKVAKARKKRR